MKRLVRRIEGVLRTMREGDGGEVERRVGWKRWEWVWGRMMDGVVSWRILDESHKSGEVVRRMEGGLQCSFK